ncbi:rCG20531 [Rattus norvegicus]|uniref:RCG20531 n=1 Tax=Rattus norvegicus TaxID=10116 RepID=A6K5I8_RAT|nr:rCG20531 [Rattus norvegicus]
MCWADGCVILRTPGDPPCYMCLWLQRPKALDGWTSIQRPLWSRSPQNSS